MTGGSRGLGRATVEALAQRGVNVVLTHKTRLTEANEVVTRVEALGAGRSRCLSAPANRYLDAFVSAFSGRAGRSWTPINLIIWSIMPGNASGMGFLNATEAEFDALYRIHVKSVFPQPKLLPLLADGGRIVNVSSGLTHHRDGEPGALCDHEIPRWKP